jgi:hypothetical protein
MGPLRSSQKFWQGAAGECARAASDNYPGLMITPHPSLAPQLIL